MVPIRSDGRTSGLAAAAVGAALAGFVALNGAALVAHALGLGLRATIVSAQSALAAPALVLAWRFADGRVWLGERRPDWRLAAAALGAGLALWLFSLGLIDLQARVWPPPPGYLDTFRALHALLRPSGPLDALVSIGVIAVAPAVCEELVFRGVVLPAVAAWRGAATGLVISSLLFGAIHLDASPGGLTAYRVPFALAVGFGFGLLRLRGGTLLAPVLAHALLNTLTFAAVPFVDEPAQETTLPHPAIGVALAVIGVLALRVLLRVVSGPSPRRSA